MYLTPEEKSETLKLAECDARDISKQYNCPATVWGYFDAGGLSYCVIRDPNDGWPEERRDQGLRFYALITYYPDGGRQAGTPLANPAWMGL